MRETHIENALRTGRILGFSGAVLVAGIATADTASGVDAAGGRALPFLAFPYVYSAPLDRHADANRKFRGIPSIAVTPGGRLWATCYGGGEGEGQDNYIMLATSGDGGGTWSDILAVIDPPCRASEPAVWVDPSGRLWWMANLYPGQRHLRDTGSQLWVLVADDPETDMPKWQSLRLLAMEMNNFNKPTVLADGRWLWPTVTGNTKE